ncbi:GIN domain-containing protein [Aquimarina sp. AU119]|uniref:GIN domain-containing protein n=1 Tax=Aquimarina sp. AU119 TaxID=2108528 RepID=UPI000D69A8F7|nr:DUF2807 domain-containing protein [Aquimarina sp. AU119]
MKRSNLILLSVLIVIFFFFLAFQLSVHRYVVKEEREEKEIVINRNVITEKRSILDFSKISVKHGIQVFFHQDSVIQLKVETLENLMPYVKTEVQDGKLVIEKIEKVKQKDTIKVFVSANKLEEINMGTGVHFETIGKVSGKDLKLEFNGDNTGNLELYYESVQCKTAPGCNVTLTGDTEEINFTTYHEK